MSVFLSLAAAALTFVERTSSPSMQVSAGTMMGNTSLYCPALTLINTFGTILSGMALRSPAVIVAVTMPNSEVIVV